MNAGHAARLKRRDSFRQLLSDPQFAGLRTNIKPLSIILWGDSAALQAVAYQAGKRGLSSKCYGDSAVVYF